MPGDRNPAADPRDLGVIINSYNRKTLLDRALGSIYEHLSPVPFEVVVVDDHSTDGSAELVEAKIASGRCPGLVLVRTPRKMSFADGVNLGIESSTAPFVCLFETDNVVNDSRLWASVPYLKAHPSVAGVGFRVTKLDGATAGNSMSFPSMLAFVVGQQLTASLGLERPSTGPRRDVVFTSPLVLSRKLMARYGLMDASQFPFCDSDIDWCRRINEAGLELHVLEDVSIVHDQGNQQSEFSRRRTLDFHRARLSYFKKYNARMVPVIRAGLLARHIIEIVTLKMAETIGLASKERVDVRLELLRSWPRDYRDLSRSAS
jgi:GT2 family glycosyltransferase